MATGVAAKGDLLGEIAASGVKHSPEGMVGLAKNGDGKIVFLENGNSRAGLTHILERHGSDFEKAGIAQGDIADLVVQAALRCTQVGMRRTRRFMSSRSRGRRPEWPSLSVIMGSLWGRIQLVDEVCATTVMAEFGCWPLWQDTEDGRVNVDPAGFGMPAALVDDLNAWADTFDRTYVPANLTDPGFPDSRAEDAFYAEGLRLAARVARALGATVAFYDGRSHETREVGSMADDRSDDSA